MYTVNYDTSSDAFSNATGLSVDVSPSVLSENHSFTFIFAVHAEPSGACSLCSRTTNKANDPQVQ